MLKRWWIGVVVLAVMGVSAMAQSGGATPAVDVVEDKMLPSQNLILPWLVGFGILVMLLIAGFKSPGRSHLD